MFVCLYLLLYNVSQEVGVAIIPSAFIPIHTVTVSALHRLNVLLMFSATSTTHHVYFSRKRRGENSSEKKQHPNVFKMIPLFILSLHTVCQRHFRHKKYINIILHHYTKMKCWIIVLIVKRRV